MNFNPETTAILTLDLQKGIFDLVPGSKAALPAAVHAVEAGRRAGIRILHVGLGFSPGHPEIGGSNPTFGRVKEMGLFVQGTESAQFDSSLTRPADTLVYKQRISAFTENTLHMILRSNRIEDLVFFGVATSGIVLSTIRRAVDLDYRCTVIQDACYDRDPEVHRVLTEKVFASQAKVLTAEAFASELN